MRVGYARVSTQDQDLALQQDALKAAGCRKLFEEKASGAQRERPALKAALEYMREGDTVVVWKLDRLARSLKQLIETVEDLGSRGLCQRCHLLHDRPEYRRRIRLTLRRRRALGDLFAGPYPSLVSKGWRR